MNVEIGTEAAQFPEKEYINGSFIAVHFFVLYCLELLSSKFMTFFPHSRSMAEIGIAPEMAA
jgi:hypothetical protein